MTLNPKIYHTLDELSTGYSGYAGRSLAAVLFAGVNDILQNHPSNKFNVTFNSVLGVNDTDIGNMYIIKNDERSVYIKYSMFQETSPTEIYNVVDKMKARVAMVTKANALKYIAMLYSVNVDYNPLHNYDMTEYQLDGEKEGEYKNTGEVVRGSKSSVLSEVNPYDNTGLNETTKTTTDNTLSLPKTESKIVHDTHVTDSINNQTFDEQDKTNKHYLARSGNIGVTTSTQMLQGFIDLNSVSVLKEFFKDISKEILLDVYTIY